MDDAYGACASCIAFEMPFSHAAGAVFNLTAAEDLVWGVAGRGRAWRRHAQYQSGRKTWPFAGRDISPTGAARCVPRNPQKLFPTGHLGHVSYISGVFKRHCP